MKKKVKVLSFDPGIRNMGIAKSEYYIDTGDFVVNQFSTLSGRTAIIRNKDKLMVFDKQLIQLDFLEGEIEKTMKYRPDYITCEDCFYYHESPAAYAALLLSVNTIERVAMAIMAKPVYKINNKSIKRVTAGTGNVSDKRTIQERLLDNHKIKIKETKANPLTMLTEHSCDAIACGYTFCTDNLLQHLYLPR